MNILENLKELKENNFWENIADIKLINLRKAILNFQEEKHIANDLLNFFRNLLSHNLTKEEIVFTDGNIRFCITEEESETLFNNREQIENKYIKAFLLTFFWQYKKLPSNKEKFEAISEALELYYQILESLISDLKLINQDYFSAAIFMRILKYSIKVSNSINSNIRFKFLSQTKKLADLEYNKENYFLLLNAIRLLIKHSSVEDAQKCLDKLEKIVAEISLKEHVKEDIYNVAIEATKKIGDKTKKEELLQKKAEIYEQRAQKADSVQAEVHFLKKAAQIYVNIPSCKEKWKNITLEIEEKSPGIIAEMIPIKVECPMDITRIIKSVKLVSDKTFPEALKELVKCMQLMPVEKQILEESAKYNGISDFLTASLVDERGLTAAIIGNDKNKYSSSFYNTLSFWWYDIWLHVLSPMISRISQEHFFTYQDIIPFCMGNPFVPKGREIIFAKGIYYFLKQDFLLSSSLLVPQIENSLRNMLYGITTISKLEKDGRQEYKIEIESLLNNLLKENKLPKRIHFYFYMLLCNDYFNIRNRIAHGLYDTDEFNSSGVFILNWLVFYCACGWSLLYEEIISQKEDVKSK